MPVPAGDPDVHGEVCEQHDGERQLRDQEHGRQDAPAAGSCRASALFEDGEDIGPRRPDCRHERKHQDCARRDGNQRREHPPVD